MLDTRLLILERCLEENRKEREHIADCMGVTARHLLRLLNKWEDEGLINFNPGDDPEIELNIDVEHALINGFMNSSGSRTVNEIRAFLDLPWSRESAETLRKLLMQFLNDKECTESEMLIDYTYRSIANFEPINIIDYAGFQVSSQTVECLYTINDRGELGYGLVKYDEWKDEELHLYLREGLLFSNGTPLTAEHVKASLDRLAAESDYAYLYSNIVNVKTAGSTHVILTINGRKNIIKYTLAQLFSAVYIELNGHIIGTGPYIIEEMSDASITLSVNKYYWKEKPEIKRIYLLPNEKKAGKAYNKTTVDAGSTFCTVAETFMLFNPLNERFTKDERGVLKVLMEESMKPDMRNFNMEEAVRNVLHKTGDGGIEISKTLRIIADEYTSGEMKYFFALMEKLGIQYSVLQMTLQEYLSMDSSELDADLVMNQEGFFSENPYMLVDLLTHCKFKDWYLKVDAFHDFLHEEHSALEFKQKSAELVGRIIEENLMIPLYPQHRVFFMPSDFTNIEMLPYGIVDYSKIIMDS